MEVFSRAVNRPNNLKGLLILPSKGAPVLFCCSFQPIRLRSGDPPQVAPVFRLLSPCSNLHVLGLPKPHGAISAGGRQKQVVRGIGQAPDLALLGRSLWGIGFLSKSGGPHQMVHLGFAFNCASSKTTHHLSKHLGVVQTDVHSCCILASCPAQGGGMFLGVMVPEERSADQMKPFP